MKLGVVLFNKGPLASGENLAAMARRAESLGFDHVAVTEHLVIPKREGEQDQYRSAKPSQQGIQAGQRKGWEALRNYHEPLITLMYLAGQTQRIRLGTSVMIAPYRNPLIAAKQLATLDALAGGRVFCGIGAGWWLDEFEALGMEEQFKTRGARTDEYLKIYRTLWNDETASHQGRFHCFSELEFSPKPLQKPLPIWIGGNGPRAMRRAAELGDMWHPLALKKPGQLEPQAIPELRRQLDQLTQAAGRPPGSVGLALRCNVRLSSSERAPMVGSTSQLTADAQAYAEAGVDSLSFDLPGASWEQAMEHLDALGRDVLPAMRS